MRNLILIILALAPMSSILAQGDWQLRKNESGIKVYTRSINGSSLEEFKGTTVLNTTPESLANLLKKVKDYEDWLPRCKEAKLHSLKNNIQIHYTQMKAPFPVSNRDCYYQYTYLKKGKGIKVVLEALPEFGPQREDVIRITKAKGYWLFEPIEGGKTKVTYQVHANPGGSIPAWLANSFVVNNPFETLQNLQRRFK